MLRDQLASEHPPVVLDIRRREAFEQAPLAIEGAVALVLDDGPPRIPEMDRDQAIVAYCLCSGEASSLRVAQWLTEAGHTNVAALRGGLPEWERLGFPVAPIDAEKSRAGISWVEAELPERRSPSAGVPSLEPQRLEEILFAEEELPIRREMAVLFVDMVDSTRLLFRYSPEKVLELVQAFMEPVVDTAVFHCGDVHDFEGDGAMLYFAGPGEAVPAAFRLRRVLQERREIFLELPDARFAIDAGPLVIGSIGTRFRRSLTFIGASINVAARILRLAPPGGIVVTEPVVRDARRTNPDLARQFTELAEKPRLKGIESGPVSVFVAERER